MALKRPQRETPSVTSEPEDVTEFELPPIQVLNREESRAHFDGLARKLLGMSGTEFIERLDAGEFEDILDDGDHSDHLYLALLSGHWATQPMPKTKALPLAARRGERASARVIEDESSDYPLTPVRTMTLEEGQAFFERQVRELLGISGSEFVKRYHAGRYDDILDDPEYSSLMYLAMLGAGERPDS